MVFQWMRSHGYARVRSDDDAEKSLNSPQVATFMKSRRVRTLAIVGVAVVVLCTLSTFTSAQTQLQEYSKDMYGKFSNSTQHGNNDWSTEKKPSEIVSSKPIEIVLSKPTEIGLSKPSAKPEPTRTKMKGNEPEGVEVKLHEPKPKPGDNLKGNEPEGVTLKPGKEGEGSKVGAKPAESPTPAGSSKPAESSQLASSPTPAASPTSSVTPSTEAASEAVNWSDFAYVQYVTNSNYLCNSLMIFESLHRLKTKADKVMLYPHKWAVPKINSTDGTTEGKQLAQARDQYGVTLVPIQIQTLHRGDSTWQDSFTKLLAFNQTQYKRVIHLDSDGTVLKIMDELFLLPPAPVAMPRAYWLDQPFLASIVIVATPTTHEWDRINTFMSTHEDSGFDMDIMDKMYGASSIIIPHRDYLLLSGEMRASSHENYLGDETEEWNATQALEDAKYLHWSEFPFPKPWIKPGDAALKEFQPDCKETSKAGGEIERDCRDRDAYLWMRNDFTSRRQKVCGREFDKRGTVEERSTRQKRAWFEPVF